MAGICSWPVFTAIRESASRGFGEEYGSSASIADPVQALRITAAVVTWGAVTLQLGLSLRLAAANGQSVAMGIATYLGFFTILTNILVAATLSVSLVAPASPLGRFFARPVVAGGVLVPIVVVAIVYHVLLRDLWDPQGWQLVADVLLHYVVPALFVVYWWLAVPKERLSWDSPGRWGTRCSCSPASSASPSSS